MKITRTFYNVGGYLVTERELNAAKNEHGRVYGESEESRGLRDEGKSISSEK